MCSTYYAPFHIKIIININQIIISIYTSIFYILKNLCLTLPAPHMKTIININKIIIYIIFLKNMCLTNHIPFPYKNYNKCKSNCHIYLNYILKNSFV